MQTLNLVRREMRAYTLLTTIVICGLACCLMTAPKIVHMGINFPFSNIVFAVFTYPIVSCICELWGKEVARQTVYLGLASQIIMTCIIQLSIVAPHADFWLLQTEYQEILSTGFRVLIASLIAFSSSQILDIVVFQRIKEMSRGRWLWLRSNIATILGQAVDSVFFIMIVFYDSNQKWDILWGSMLVKISLSILMTPFVYLIIIAVNRYLKSQTQAFVKTKNIEIKLNPGLI